VENEQPTALRLADALDVGEISYTGMCKAADELRRLHRVNAMLLESLCCVRDMVGHPDNLEFIDAAVSKAEGRE
jgi:hypothetical protein